MPMGLKDSYEIRILWDERARGYTVFVDGLALFERMSRDDLDKRTLLDAVDPWHCGAMRWKSGEQMERMTKKAEGGSGR